MLQFLRFFVIIKISIFVLQMKEEKVLGTYNLPRNVKGEGRILYVFSTKALLYAFAGVVFGFFIYLILTFFKLDMIGFIVMGIFGLLGFVIGTFKMPESVAFGITKKTGGEPVDEVVKRFVKFKLAKNKVYVYQKPIKAKEKIQEVKK